MGIIYGDAGNTGALKKFGVDESFSSKIKDEITASDEDVLKISQKIMLKNSEAYAVLAQ